MPNYDDLISNLQNATKAARKAESLSTRRDNRDEERFARNPSGVFKALDYLNRGQYMVLNPLRRATDRENTYTPGEYLSSMWKGLKGEERSQTTDVLDNLGWRPTTKKGKIARGVVGLAGDILLDPTTYIPLGALTKTGKLAKAGKLIKVGDRVFNLTNKAHIDDIAKIIQAGAGSADDIAKATKALKGVFRAGAADDIVKAIGQGAEVVRLAPNWAKQMKTGQRALLQFQLPGFLGGASARIPTPFEQRIGNAATYVNRRLQAGRMLADKAILNALPDASLGTRIAANKENLIKIGSDFFNLASPQSAGKARSALLAQAAERFTDPEQFQKVADTINTLFRVDKNVVNPEKIASGAMKTIEELGLDAAVQSAKGLRAKEAAKRFGNSWFKINAGRTANKASEILNIIPEGIKKVRRHAEGVSGLSSDIITKDIQDALGKEGFDTLMKGIKKGDKVTVTMGGKPFTVSGDKLVGLRLEGLEGLGSRRVLNEIARKEAELGRKLNLSEIIDSLDVLDVSKGAQAGADINGIKGVAGLDPETVQRMKNTLRSWGNIDGVGKDGLGRLTEAFKRLEKNLIDMGALNATDAEIRDLTEGLAYVPRRLALSPAESVGMNGTKVADRVRQASRGMTFFEAQNGYRTKTATQYLLDNIDKPVAYAPDGTAITGGDVLGHEFMRARAKTKTMFGRMMGERYRLGRQQEKLAKAKNAYANKEAGVFDEMGGWWEPLKKEQKADARAARLDQRIGLKEAQNEFRKLDAQQAVEDFMPKLDLNPSPGNIRTMGYRLSDLDKANNAQVSQRLLDLADYAQKEKQALGVAKGLKVGKRYDAYKESLKQMSEQIGKWENKIDLTKVSLDEATKAYEEAVANANKILEQTRALNFSTEMAEAVAGTINAATKNIKYKSIVSGLLSSGVKLDPQKSVPFGFVRASDILTDRVLKEAAKMGESAGEYEELIKFISGKEVQDALKNTVVPYSFVQPLKNMLEVGNAPAGAIMRLYDQFQSMLKPLMLSRPSTQVRNTISSFFMSWAAGDFSNPVQGLENLVKSTKYVMGGKGGKVLINGVEYPMRDIWKLFTEYGGHESGQIVRELAMPLAQMESRALRKMKTGVDKITAPMTRWWAETTEDSFRFSHFISELQKGATPEDAMASVARHFYDYGDLSKFEKNVARRLIPFYTFTRKNLAANLYYLANNRGYLKVPQVLANNVNSITEDEKTAINLSRLDNAKNKWLADQGAFRLPWAGGQRIATMEGFLPQTDIQQVLPGQLAEKAISGLSPILKTPYAVLKNYDSFKKKPIYTPAKPRDFFFGIGLDPRITYALTPAGNLHVFNKMAQAVSPETAKSYGAYIPDEVAKEPSLWKRLGTQARDELGFRNYLLENDEVRMNLLMDTKNALKDIERQKKRIKHPAPGIKKKWEAETKRLTAIMKSLEKKK